MTTAHAQAAAALPAARPAGEVALPEISRGAQPYVVRAVVDGGRIDGVVEVDRELAADSAIVPPEQLRRACGARVVPPAVPTRDGKGAGVAVWLEGVREGKALPAIRRHEVLLDACQLAPRVQTVVAGGTLHLHSADPMRALVRFVRWPAGDTVGTVATNNAGQVVPDDRVLAEAGAIEVAGLQPTWLRAWVLVLDHPYATTSTATGAFELDAVPPGQYTLVAWHERLGRVEQPVTVTAGGATTVSLRFGGANAAR